MSKYSFLKRRNRPSISKRAVIVIWSEGEVTEPTYFRRFKISNLTVKINCNRKSTDALVRQAIKEKKKEDNQTWCVFDKDDFTDESFNNAIRLAEENKIGIACSNQSFEYWLYLHFVNHNGAPLDRKTCLKKLQKELSKFNLDFGVTSKEVTPEFFTILDGIEEKTGVSRLNQAIERGRKIYNSKNNPDKLPFNPAKSESFTTVFMLCEELLKYRV